MAQGKRKAEEDTQEIQALNVVDLILMDHVFVKECIETLSDENCDKKKKLSVAKDFLEALLKHSEAEKKAVYAPLEANEELHFNILEAQIEHELTDQKVKELMPQLEKTKDLSDELEAELTVLSELVKHHLIEEEVETLPKMKEEVDDETLLDMGIEFAALRQFTPSEIIDAPEVEKELFQWKDSVKKVSSELLAKMDNYVENLKQ